MDYTDPQTFTAWINAIIGAFSSIIIAYGALRAKGLIVYPAAKLESGKAKLKALIEQNEAAEQVIDILDNISPEELAGILERAKELSGDGFSAAEAQELGILIVNAVKEK